ncbi:signal recognition particle-docking protein FtsY [Aurantimonas sp. HBX-1]|uniref:signal recognition particle-docking protein FtsY n=1 Tax=Aurantimonas sp. HBX-1 TaxID=2906072 RepID=UPI001F377DC4|nr:signal recognition particle-docking protein FtsY [Aurantimonas sp. HBX-1]UIJ74261.1 signal recognition particle-docking protein FtsY [Aurantimonas sp. HBX-1]
MTEASEDEEDGADFSFLEAPEPEPADVDFSFLEPGVPPVDGETREPSLEAEAAAPPVAPASEDDHLDGHGPEDADEADFSWLDADLPPEEEDSVAPEAARIDPSFGAPADEAPLAPSPAHPPIDPDAGFRLRQAPAPAAEPVRAPWLLRLREGLSRSSSQLTGSIGSIFTARKLDEETLQDFEDVLIRADLGLETALRITDRLSEGRFGRTISGAEVRSILAQEVEKTLAPVAVPLELDLEKKPHVILVVGVNGTGKTTTIGKLAAKLTRAGLKVTLCAGDTFRAAAVEQLRIWGERTGSEVVAKAIGADAAGLAYEAYDRAIENGSDVLIIDTAGRLQNKTELMAELEKIVRVLQRREADAPHTVLQTLDATTGQNALQQVEIFRNVAGVNGLVMTKLDGTARGGILVAIAAKHKLPVYFVGVGEGIDDLEPFKAKDFADAIAGTTAEV